MATASTRTVSEFMSRELLYLSQDARVDVARSHILDFGVTAVPVLDDEHRPIGVVSLRDLVHGRGRPQMSSPAHTIPADTPVEQAARTVAETNMHHLVVVDTTGRAVGMLSALDLLRALVGLPAAPPRRVSERDEAQDDDPEGIRVP
jgi:CBS-domain-containing membrane protein